MKKSHKLILTAFGGRANLMKSFPKPLTADEERECLIKCREGNKEARNLLIERNLRLVAYIVKKYSVNEKNCDDLISIGTIGLIKAIDSFDVDKGIRLATYASRCIDNAQQYSWLNSSVLKLGLYSEHESDVKYY